MAIEKKTHTKDEGFFALINVLKGELTFNEFLDFWETVMDDSKAIKEARDRTKKLDILEITKPEDKDIN